MLQLTPSVYKMLRRRKRAEKEKNARQLSKARRARLISVVAAFMRTEWAKGRAPTKLTYESAMRHGLRSGLCLQGWPWAEADEAARDVVGAALRQIGAERPSWREAQPEWTQPGALPVERVWCARCGKRLPEGHRLWCGPVCAGAAKADRQRRDWGEAAYAKWKAGHAAWRERQPDRECQGCGRLFKPDRKSQRYCRYECSNIAR